VPPKTARERTIVLFVQFVTSSLWVTADVFQLTNWCTWHTSNKKCLNWSAHRPELHKEKAKKVSLWSWWKTWPWHWLALLLENFLFPESLVEIFSNPRKNHQWATNSKKIYNWEPKALKPGKATGYGHLMSTSYVQTEFELCASPRSNLPNNLGNGRKV